MKPTTPCKRLQPIRFQKVSASCEWTIPPLSGVSHYFDGRTGERPICFSVIVPRQTNRCLIFHCDWVDQGWGARKGRILVVAQERPEYLDNRLKSLPFASGTIVAMSPTVMHCATQLKVPFLPMRNTIYQIWCIVGGGGYNTLRIENMKLLRLGLPPCCWRRKWPKRHIADNTNPNQSFSALPFNLKQLVVAFLAASDAMHLMQTCKSMKSEVAISSISTRLVEKDAANTPTCFAVYVPSKGAHLHSVTIQFDITNREYWINNRVQALLVSHPRLECSDSTGFARRVQDLCFQKGRIVAKSPTTKTLRTSVTMTCALKSDEVYQLWLCEDVAGCAALLELDSLTIHTLGFGELSAAFEVTYTGFSKRGRDDGFALRNSQGGVMQLMRRFSEQ